MSLTANYIAWGNNPDTEKVIAAVLRPVLISTGSTLTLYWADSAGKWDDGAHFFEPVITGGPSIENSTQILTHGVSRPTFGALRLGLVSGSTVDLQNLVAADSLVGGAYAWHGQPITIYSGGPALAWADWAVLLDGYMGHPSPTSLPFYGKDEAVFKIKVPPNVYVGR